MLAPVNPSISSKKARPIGIPIRRAAQRFTKPRATNGAATKIKMTNVARAMPIPMPKYMRVYNIDGPSLDFHNAQLSPMASNTGRFSNTIIRSARAVVMVIRKMPTKSDGIRKTNANTPIPQ